MKVSKTEAEEEELTQILSKLTTILNESYFWQFYEAKLNIPSPMVYFDFESSQDIVLTVRRKK